MDRKSMLISALVIAVSVSALSISIISASSNRQVEISGVPKSIAYQGHLQNSDGSPLADEEHQLEFALYTGETATEPVWTESHTATTQDGFFSVMLGSKHDLAADLFGGQALFLGISVDGADEFSPRQQLASVPFAIMASHATTSSGLDCDGCITSEQIADGALGLSSPNGTYRIEVTDEGIIFRGPDTEMYNKTVTFAFEGGWHVTARGGMQIAATGLPGLSEPLTLTGSDVNVTADRNINVTAEQNINADAALNIGMSAGLEGSFDAGQSMDVQAGAELNLESNGSASLDGALVQLGGGCMPVARVGDPVTTTGTVGAGTGTITSGSTTVLAC